MWFIGVEVEQETSAPPPEKKSWISPCKGWGEAVIQGPVLEKTFFGPSGLSLVQK